MSIAFFAFEEIRLDSPSVANFHTLSRGHAFHHQKDTLLEPKTLALTAPPEPS